MYIYYVSIHLSERKLTFLDILTYTADNQPLRPHMVVLSTSKLLVLSPLVLITPYSDVTIQLHYICRLDLIRPSNQASDHYRGWVPHYWCIIIQMWVSRGFVYGLPMVVEVSRTVISLVQSTAHRTVTLHPTHRDW